MRIDDPGGTEGDDVNGAPSWARDRRVLEATLERLVAENRVTIAVIFPLVGVSLLVLDRAGLVPSALAMNPYLLVGANLVMVSPLVAVLVPLVDRRALLGLVAIAMFTWGIELVGVVTGYPYGTFSYQTELGPMLLGRVPLALPVFFVPILLNGYLLSILLLGSRASARRRFLLTLTFVLAMDLVLDPGAVALGFWAWDTPGRYYGVPAVNFAGWVLSGTVAIALVDRAFDPRRIEARLGRCPFAFDTLVTFLIFWGLVNLAFGNWVPVVIVLGFAFTLVRAEWFGLPGVS